MRVLHVTPSYYPAVRFGGPVRSVHALNRALIQQGLRLDVMTTNAGIINQPEISLQKQILIQDVPVTFYPFKGYEHYNFSIPFLINIFKKVPDYDLIHITAVWNFPVIATTLACLWFKKPYILSPRGTIYAETIAHRSARLKKIYYNFIAGISVKKANMLHFTTRDEAEKVMQYHKLKNPYCVIYNGLDIQEINQSLELNKQNIRLPFFLFLGRIDKKKGLDILIEAFSEFSSQTSGFQLKIAGPDNEGYQAEIETLCLKYKIQNSVIFTGALEGTEKWKMYREAFAFVLPSYSENFGMSVAEAMLCNCPVIISDQVGLADDVLKENAGWVVPARSVELAEAMKECTTQENIRIQKSDNALKFARAHFDIQNIAKQFIQVYQKLLYKA